MVLWTEDEKAEYLLVKSGHLKELYAAKGLPADNPEARAKYLAEDFLKLTMTDHDLLMRTAAKKGKPQALKELEKMAVEEINRNY